MQYFVSGRFQNEWFSQYLLFEEEKSCNFAVLLKNTLGGLWYFKLLTFSIFFLTSSLLTFPASKTNTLQASYFVRIVKLRNNLWNEAFRVVLLHVRELSRDQPIDGFDVVLQPIGQSSNAFSILGFSLAGKRRGHVLIIHPLADKTNNKHLPKPFQSHKSL